MSGASDKSRFYLEDSVPELREWERREIFTKEEISSIASKRSNFEHEANARNCKPSTYAQYAEYEMNLDSLRRKRVQRKGVKATKHTGQRRIFSILDRATKKFPGNIGLWMQYIEYARAQGAHKKLAIILTDMLRMHPTKSELWIYAARWAMDAQADMGNARSFMQRGLRFCKNSGQMYIEYARLEMVYIAKIEARRRILGLEEAVQQRASDAPTEDETSPDTIPLPGILAGEIDGDEASYGLLNGSTAEAVESTPATNGAIPLAIFEAATKQLPRDEVFAGEFFDMFADFQRVSCTYRMLEAVVEHLLSFSPPALNGLSCRCRLPIAVASRSDPAFPSALRRTLAEIKSVMAETTTHKKELATTILTWLSPMAHDEDFGPELQRVIAATEARLLKTANTD